jgi:exopolysaccharide production protein ExoQ
MHQQSDRSLIIAERVFGVSTLMFLMGAVLPVWRNPDDSSLQAQTSDPLALALQVFVYGFGLLFMLPVRHRLKAALIKNPVLVALILLPMVSTLWSEVRFYTFRRSLIFAFTNLLALYFGTRYSLRQLIRITGTAFFAVAVLSVVFIVVLPRYGFEVSQNEGAWRGVFIQKNIFARYMVFSVLTFYCLRAYGLKAHLIKGFKIAVALFLLAGSLSTGSYLVMLVSVLLIPAYRVFHLGRRTVAAISVVAGTVLVPLAVYIASNASSFLDVLGSKSATLSGRGPLWTIVSARISEHPLLGFGYGSFWMTAKYSVWSLIHWQPLKAHNGYLDLCLDVGMVGLALFILNCGVIARRAVKLIAKTRALEARWPLMVLTLIVLYNVFETELLVQNGFLWTLFVAITVATQRALREIDETAAEIIGQPEPIEYKERVPLFQ